MRPLLFHSNVAESLIRVNDNLGFHFHALELLFISDIFFSRFKHFSIVINSFAFALIHSLMEEEEEASALALFIFGRCCVCLLVDYAAVVIDYYSY